MNEKAIYFPGFNGIRAIAALIVLFWHIDQFMPLFGLPEAGYYRNGMAHHAVDMFFVLSGFLITYLLLTEKQKTGGVSIKHFYLRRIFRIWPVYYLALGMALAMVFLGVIGTPEKTGQSILFYTFLLANVAYVLHLDLAAITPLWSVGVEEQFYALWPVILKNTKRVLRVLLAVIGVYFALKLAAFFISPDGFTAKILDLTRIDLMALGGIGAYVVFKNMQWVLRIIYSPPLQVISWLILVYSCFFKPIHIFSFIDYEVNAAFYFILILNVGTNPKTLVKLENAVLNFLGKISYGLYVYHLIIVFLLVYVFRQMNVNLADYGMYGKVVVYILVPGFTILLATLSYRHFEAPILKLKGKFSAVKSSSSSIEDALPAGTEAMPSASAILQNRMMKTP